MPGAGRHHGPGKQVQPEEQVDPGLQHGLGLGWARLHHVQVKAGRKAARPAGQHHGVGSVGFHLVEGDQQGGDGLVSKGVRLAVVEVDYGHVPVSADGDHGRGGGGVGHVREPTGATWGPSKCARYKPVA